MTLWQVRATLDDRPGFLAVLTASLALRSVNILAVQVHATEHGAVDEFLVDAPDGMTAPELVEAVRRGRGRDAWAAPTDARGLVDPPTQTLGLAARLVRDPDGLAAALAALLGAEVTRRPSTVAARLGPERTSMVLPDPRGGALLVSRAAPVFTPAEYARAQALVELARAADRPAANTTGLLLTDGTELVLRPATPHDGEAVAAMHARCDPDSLRRRYLGGATPRPAPLARLLDARRGHALVAVDGDQVVAFGNLVADGRLGELAVLVEDAVQRRGIGTALLRRLVRRAAAGGCVAVVVHTHADNAPLLRTLARLGLDWAYEQDGAVLTAVAPIPATPAADVAAVPVSGRRSASG